MRQVLRGQAAVLCRGEGRDGAQPAAEDRDMRGRRVADEQRGVEEGHGRADRPAGPLEGDRCRVAPSFGCDLEAFPCRMRQVLRAQGFAFRQCGRRIRGEPPAETRPAR